MKWEWRDISQLFYANNGMMHGYSAEDIYQAMELVTGLLAQIRLKMN